MTDEKRPEGPPARRPPPTNGDRPKPPGPQKPPEPRFDYVPVDTGPESESSWKTWLIVLILIGAMVAGYLQIKDQLIPGSGDDEVAQTNAEQPESKKKASTKRDKKRRATARKPVRDRRDRRRADESYEDKTFWEDDELETNERFRLGDVFARGDDSPEGIEQPREPEFVPPPDWWQPDGTYSPTSQWTRPGVSAQEVVELDVTKGSSSPLKPAQIERVLTEQRLMPCYREVAQKVPQVRGRLALDVWIESDGSVSHVKITRSKLRSRKVEDCIVKTVRRLKFPQTSGRSTRFSTHFDFN